MSPAPEAESDFVEDPDVGLDDGPDDDLDDDLDDGRPEARSASRVLVLVAAMLVMLLVGAAGGVMITLSRGNATAPPDTSSVDVGFAQDMRMHHLQAVTMAGIERDRTTDPVLRGIAFDIESTQLAQSSELAGWLTVWEQPDLPAPGAGHMAWMSESGTHAHSNGTGGTTTGTVQTMPGMATTAELNQLRKVSGRALDVLFLQLMLRHHQGGLEMAEYGAQHASKGYVRNLATKIVESQQAESRLMTKYLRQRGGTPLPAP
ncbi:DUF305 domain-containing protein [Actinophytocola sp.]|uniref:DUF305 domain-containing protein n=1 Tax=Actinophytocola sp. TaxID=1872138 RepID=UPI002ED83BB5